MPILDKLKLRDLSEDQVNHRISDNHVEVLSRLHLRKWRRMCSHLYLNDIVVHDIDMLNISEAEKRKKFLEVWQERKGSDATYEVLLDALCKIGCRKDMEKVYELLKNDS